jgi:hypothetical protein
VPAPPSIPLTAQVTTRLIGAIPSRGAAQADTVGADDLGVPVEGLLLLPLQGAGPVVIAVDVDEGPKPDTAKDSATAEPPTNQ